MSTSSASQPRAAQPRHAVRPRARVLMRRRSGPEASVVVALALSVIIAPTAHADEPAVQQLPSPETQSMTVDGSVAVHTLSRGGFEATPAQIALVNRGTNAAWAELVLLYGGWPRTEQNITVILRWMRQENGTDNWFNRNNPLNNGYGSGGGSGLGSYVDLITAAQMAAENLQVYSGYVDIVAALEDGTSADAVARAIWASPWASSHYANGTHWSTLPVDIVEAPRSAW
jgi:hypothetical protein